MLPSNFDLDRDSLPFQHLSVQAQSPAHSEPFNISLRSSRPPSPFSTSFLGNQAQHPPAILLRTARAPDHPNQQSACSSSSINDNDLTALPSDSSSTPLRPVQPVTISINGYNSTNGSTPSSAFSHGTSAPLDTPLRRSTRLGRASHTNSCLCCSAPSTVLRRASTDPIIASNTSPSLSSYIQPTSSARQLPTPSSSRPTSSSSATHSRHLPPNSRSTATRRPASLLCPGSSTRAPSPTALHRHLGSSLHSDPALPSFPCVDPLHVPNGASCNPPPTLHHSPSCSPACLQPCSPSTAQPHGPSATNLVGMPCNRGSVLLPDPRCEHPPRSSSYPIVRDILSYDLPLAPTDLPPSTGPAPRLPAPSTSGHPAALSNLQPEQGQVHESSESQLLFLGPTAPSSRACPAAGISTTPNTSAPRATGYRSRSQGTRSSSSFQRTATGTLSSQSRPHQQVYSTAPPPSLHSGIYLPGFSCATLLINVLLSSLHTLLGLAPSRDFIHSSRVPRIRSIFNLYLAMVNINPTQPLPWLKLLCLPHLLFTDSQSIPAPS